MIINEKTVQPEQALSGDSVKVESPTGISVLVVGAGVGGLMMALECVRNGHNVRVIERAPAPSTAGDFFSIGINVIRHVYHHWPDLGKLVEQINYPAMIAYHKITGERLSVAEPPPSGKLEATHPDGTVKIIPFHRHSRPKFVGALLAQAKGMDIDVTYGTKVVDYYEDPNAGKAGVILENGDRIAADLVVAADGLGTKSHKIVSGHDIRAWPSGFSIFRTCFPVELSTSDPELDTRWPLTEDGRAIFEIWGGDNLSFFVQRYTDLMSWQMIHKSSGAGMESWSQTVDVSKVLSLTSTIPGFPDIATRLIKSTPADHIVDWEIMWRNPQENWVSPTGRIVQVGDSAHAFLPSSGNGATQAMEDAISLATCLRIGGLQDLALATRVHNKLRFERTSCIQLQGFINHQLQNNRNLEIVGEDGAAFKIKLGAWISTHDSQAYALENYQHCLDAVCKGGSFKATNTPPGYVYKPWDIQELFRTIDAGEKLQFEGDWS